MPIAEKQRYSTNRFHSAGQSGRLRYDICIAPYVPQASRLLPEEHTEFVAKSNGRWYYFAEFLTAGIKSPFERSPVCTIFWMVPSPLKNTSSKQIERRLFLPDSAALW